MPKDSSTFAEVAKPLCVLARLSGDLAGREQLAGAIDIGVSCPADPHELEAAASSRDAPLRAEGERAT